MVVVLDAPLEAFPIQAVPYLAPPALLGIFKTHQELHLVIHVLLATFRIHLEVWIALPVLLGCFKAPTRLLHAIIVLLDISQTLLDKVVALRVLLDYSNQIAERRALFANLDFSPTPQAQLPVYPVLQDTINWAQENRCAIPVQLALLKIYQCQDHVSIVQPDTTKMLLDPYHAHLVWLDTTLLHLVLLLVNHAQVVFLLTKTAFRHVQRAQFILSPLQVLLLVFLVLAVNMLVILLVFHVRLALREMEQLFAHHVPLEGTTISRISQHVLIV
jgi:predicted amino acid-binding ACT domain protein